MCKNKSLKIPQHKKCRYEHSINAILLPLGMK